MNIEILQTKMFLLKQYKKPKVMSKHIGIEFEFISKYDQALLTIAACKYNLDKVLHIGSDSSIKAGKDKPYEARLLCKESELKSYLNKISKWFKEIKAYINTSCGLHVHLDMRRRDFLESYNKLMSSQNLLFKIVPVHRKRNKFCRKQTIKDIKYIKYGGLPEPASWFVDDYGNRVVSTRAYADRYTAINPCAYKQHKTIEIRIFEGTVNTKEVYDWCRFLISLLNSKQDITEQSYLKVGSIPKDTKQFLLTRIKKYGTKKRITKSNKRNGSSVLINSN